MDKKTKQTNKATIQRNSYQKKHLREKSINLSVAYHSAMLASFILYAVPPFKSSLQAQEEVSVTLNLLSHSLDLQDSFLEKCWKTCDFLPVRKYPSILVLIWTPRLNTPVGTAQHTRENVKFLNIFQSETYEKRTGDDMIIQQGELTNIWH